MTNDNDSTRTHGPIDRFLAELSAGAGIRPSTFTDDARLDATVPNWRFTQLGAAAVAGQFSHWYDLPTVIENLRRSPVADGEVVEFDLSWTEDGVPHAAHQVHLITLADGRICADTVFCGGRWSAALLAEMEAAGAH